MTEATQIRAIANYHHNTIKIIQRIESGKVGDTVLLAELEEIIGLKVTHGGRGYSYIRSAIRY